MSSVSSSKNYKKSLIVSCTMVLLCVYEKQIYSENFSVPRCAQIKGQWCWAAASEAVLKYYGINKTQTECAYLITSQNQPQPIRSIQKILTTFHCPNTVKSNHIFSFEEIQSEAEQKRPFIIFWHWNSGGGHFVVFSGCRDSIIRIMNPAPVKRGGWDQGTYKWVKYAQNKGYWNGTVWTNRSTVEVARSGDDAKVKDDFVLLAKPSVLQLDKVDTITFYVPQKTSACNKAMFAIFDAVGTLIYKKSVEINTSIQWRIRSKNQTPLNPGTYLAIVSWKTPDGCLKRASTIFDVATE